MLDTLEDLWVEVFAGGRVTEENGTGEGTDSGTNDGTVVDTMWQQAPAFSQRLAKQLLQPEDMICAWYQGQLAEPAPAASEEATAEEAQASPAQTAAVQSGAETETAATAAAPDTETKTIMLGGETLTIQSALRAEPKVVTAVAQAYTEDGQALPASVSMQFYTLGLETTGHAGLRHPEAPTMDTGIIRSRAAMPSTGEWTWVRRRGRPFWPSPPAPWNTRGRVKRAACICKSTTETE